MSKTRLKLSHAFGEFLANKKKTIAKSTYNNYATLSRQFTATFREDPWLDNVTAKHIHNYLARYDHPPTHNIALGQVRVFFEWCVKWGYLKRNPADPIDSMPEIQRGGLVKKRVPVEEWGNILDAADRYHPVERALIAAGMFLGCRGNELRNIKVGDLTIDEDGTVTAVKVFKSKQNWEVQVPVSLELADELDRWLGWYRNKVGDLPPNAYLFPARPASRRTHNSKGRFDYGPEPDAPVKPFTPTSPAVHGRVVARALKETGHYQKGEGTHTLRRSVATALYEEDIERGYSEALDTVRTFLGHKQTSTTELYIGTSSSARRLEERLTRKPMFRRNTATNRSNVVPIHPREGIG